MHVRRKSNKKYLNSSKELKTTQKKEVIQPFQLIMLPVRGGATYAPTNGAVEATPEFDRKEHSWFHRR